MGAMFGKVLQIVKDSCIMSYVYLRVARCTYFLVLAKAACIRSHFSERRNLLTPSPWFSILLKVEVGLRVGTCRAAANWR
jgi:hypothetical protein